MKEIKKIDVLITHKDCADGTGSALSVIKYCEDTEQGRPEIIFMSHSDKNEIDIEAWRDKHVMIADFSFDREVCEQIHKVSKSLIIIDHHTTAETELAGLDYAIFDMSKSGAVLVWEYLFPNTTVPDLLLHIQDRDIWKWELPNSKAFSAAFGTMPQVELVGIVDIDLAFGSDIIARAITEGNIMLDYQQAIIDKAAIDMKEGVSTIELNGYTGTCTNSTHLVSELGHMYSGHYDFSLQYSMTQKDIEFSLRSRGTVDVGAIARSFGGGGHRNASGFSFPIDDFDFNTFFMYNLIRRHKYNCYATGRLSKNIK